MLALRDQKGWTQREAVRILKEKTGIQITPAYLSAIEKGDRNPSLAHAKALAELYQTSIEELFFDPKVNEWLTGSGIATGTEGGI